MVKLTGIICKETPHFTWEEVFRSSTATQCNIDNTNIPDEYLTYVINTAKMMERVRTLFNINPCNPHTVNISSWYRCEKLNNAVGGTKTSHHRFGMAVDFSIVEKKTKKKLTIKEVCQKIIDSKIPFTQLIDEYGSWTHISFQENNYKRQVLTFKRDSKGKIIKLPGLL